MILNDLAIAVLQKLVNVFISVINAFIGLFLYPLVVGINTLFSALFEDYEPFIIEILSSIETIINSIIVPSLLWFVNLVPPLTFHVCLMFLGLWLLIWQFELTVGVIIKLLVLVKRTIPFV